MTSPVCIRVANENDTPAMICMVNAAFSVETFLEGTRTDQGRMAEMMRKGEFLVGTDEAEKIVACVYIQRHGKRGYFGMLAVDPSAQQKGYGRTLVEAAESHCRSRGCTAMDISVLSLRPELLPFYEDLGYRKVRAEEFHPSRPLKAGFGCHSIIMSKRL